MNELLEEHPSFLTHLLSRIQGNKADYCKRLNGISRNTLIYGTQNIKRKFSMQLIMYRQSKQRSVKMQMRLYNKFRGLLHEILYKVERKCGKYRLCVNECDDETVLFVNIGRVYSTDPKFIRYFKSLAIDITLVFRLLLSFVSYYHFSLN